ncbi:type II secretion system F family protein [Photobacterium leiognathi]|uniref:type II secretion system F family protein n=1 Tax=Photobacterium leiognathi TaxID=553611 RepID=UPI002737705E|nr:type II secretion system F family protein [Photobacterium leiognathi]
MIEHLIILLLGLSLAIAWGISEWFRRKERQIKVNRYLNYQQRKRHTKLDTVIAYLTPKNQAELEQQFIDAGFYNRNWPKYFHPLKLVVVLLVGMGLFISPIILKNKVLIGSIALIILLVLPDTLLSIRKKAITYRVSHQLPYMLDMMAVCIQTGMTMESALAYLSVELRSFDKYLCFYIKKASDTAKIKGLEKALNDLCVQVPTPEIRSFALTLIQNLQYGTSIATVLSDLSEDMRKSQVLSIEEKIGKLAAQMSVPLILFIMFPIVILILAPGMMQMTLDLG